MDRDDWELLVETTLRIMRRNGMEDSLLVLPLAYLPAGLRAHITGVVDPDGRELVAVSVLDLEDALLAMPMDVVAR
jgi:hypothetical protein